MTDDYNYGMPKFTTSQFISLQENIYDFCDNVVINTVLKKTFDDHMPCQDVDKSEHGGHHYIDPLNQYQTEYCGSRTGGGDEGDSRRTISSPLPPPIASLPPPPIGSPPPPPPAPPLPNKKQYSDDNDFF